MLRAGCGLLLSFSERIAEAGVPELRRSSIETVQVNVGKYCNQTCRHCHVNAGPARREKMTRKTAERIAALLESTPSVRVVDITGGAPELNENFRFLVEESIRLGKEVIDRCNLTVLLLPETRGLAEFLADSGVEIVASLPCYDAKNVEAQRGEGVFEESVEAIRLLNALGYASNPALTLTLVYNPIGASLPPPQDSLEAAYRRELRERFDIRFDRLITITNMPISRFAEDLKRQEALEGYMNLLDHNFNPSTIPGLMCRSLISVGWDGSLHDCDFNQMLDMRRPESIWSIESFAELSETSIATGRHCFGCTAGAGSSCSGAIS